MRAMNALTFPGGATFSLCGAFRYELWRNSIFGAGTCVFIGLNPSTADADKDDPTIRRCINFAHGWGFERLMMLNLFAFRATDPAVMMAHPSPVGGDNDEFLRSRAQAANLVVAAWGVHGHWQGRGGRVRAMLAREGVKLHHLGLTRCGQPKHPLYLKGTTRPEPWEIL